MILPSFRALTTFFPFARSKHDYEQRIQFLSESRKALESQLFQSQEREDDLATRLHDMEQQYASLRNHLQIQDSREPREVVESFRTIKQRIGNFCSTLSATISDAMQEAFPDISHSTHAVHPEELRKLLPTTWGLYVSTTGGGREIEDFIYYALLHILGSELKRNLFDHFHPRLKNDSTMSDIYEGIRNQGQHRCQTSVRSATHSLFKFNRHKRSK